MSPFRRAVSLGVLAAVAVEGFHYTAVWLAGRSPDWTIVFNWTIYAGAGFLAAAPPRLARSAWAGAIVGGGDGLLALGAAAAAGKFPNQAKWGWLVAMMAVGGCLFGMVFGALGGMVARWRARQSQQAGA